MPARQLLLLRTLTRLYWVYLNACSGMQVVVETMCAALCPLSFGPLELQPHPFNLAWCAGMRVL
jgi:hypothetical protein